MISQLYEKEEIFSKAYTYSLRAKDVQSAVTQIQKVMKNSYHSEQDLFIFRLCLEVIIRLKEDLVGVNKVQGILDHFINQKNLYGHDVIEKSPLINLIKMIVEVLKIRDFELYKKLLNMYGHCLERDAYFREYLDKIAQLYFGATIKPPNFMQQMMNNMMGGGANSGAGAGPLGAPATANPLAALMGNQQ